MSKNLKEFMLRQTTGQVDLEFDDDSTQSYNMKDVVTATSDPVTGAVGFLPAYLSGLNYLASSTYVPSGITSNDTDAQNIAALFQRYPVVRLVPGATYYGNIVIPDGKFLISDGQAKAKIFGLTNSSPVISRSGCTGISGLDIQSATFGGDDIAPNSIGVSFTNSQNTSFTRDCYIHNVSNCLYSNGSYVYSNIFENIQFGRFREAAIYFNCVGATGNVYNNLYSQDWSAYPTSKMTLTGSVFQFLGSHDEGVMNQINVEHVVANGAFLFNGCNNFKLNSVHIEGFEASGNYGALINIVNSNVSIDSMTAVYCTIDAAKAANYSLAKFTVSGGIQSSLRLSNYKDKGWTLTGSPTRNRFYRGGTTTQTPDPIIWVNGYESPVFGGGDYMPQNGNDPQVQYGSGPVVATSAWNGSKLLTLGAYKIWVDSSGRLRIKSGTPTSETDGTVVGTQA